MNRLLFVEPEAEVEISESSDWYGNRAENLRIAFLQDVDHALQLIRDNPHQYQIAFGEVRRVILRRFPYALFYVVSGGEINIVACFHGHRDPRSLRARVSGPE
jgi:toxin ParE1/3/4